MSLILLSEGVLLPRARIRPQVTVAGTQPLAPVAHTAPQALDTELETPTTRIEPQAPHLHILVVKLHTADLLALVFLALERSCQLVSVTYYAFILVNHSFSNS